MSVTQVGKLFTALIVYVLSLQVLGKATFKEARSPGQQQVLFFRCAAFQLCCPLRLFPTTAPRGPSAGLSMPGLGAPHYREDRCPLPGWKIRSEPVSSRAQSHSPSGQLRLTRFVIPSEAGALPRAHLHRRALVAFAAASAVRSLCTARSQPPAAPQPSRGS